MRIYIHSRKGKVFMDHNFGKGTKKFPILYEPGRTIGIILNDKDAFICKGNTDLSIYTEIVKLDKGKNLFIDFSNLVEDTIEIKTQDIGVVLLNYKKMSYTDIQFLLEDSTSSYKWTDKTKLIFDELRIFTKEICSQNQ